MPQVKMRSKLVPDGCLGGAFKLLGLSLKILTCTAF